SAGARPRARRAAVAGSGADVEAGLESAAGPARSIIERRPRWLDEMDSEAQAAVDYRHHLPRRASIAASHAGAHEGSTEHCRGVCAYLPSIVFVRNVGRSHFRHHHAILERIALAAIERAAREGAEYLVSNA